MILGARLLVSQSWLWVVIPCARSWETLQGEKIKFTGSGRAMEWLFGSGGDLCHLR